MYNSRHSRSHPLTQQVPLTVSPFTPLPTPPTLSYNYKSMPSALPPSQTGIGATTTTDQEQQDQQQQQQQKPKYIIAPSGQAAHPSDILASCRHLRDHLSRMQSDAERELQAFEERIRQRELAEKRRVAPGWLDTEERLLVPEREAGVREEEGEEEEKKDGEGRRRSEMPAGDDGAELDRAFGVLNVGDR